MNGETGRPEIQEEAEQPSESVIASSLLLEPIKVRIMFVLYKLQILGSLRIGEILRLSAPFQDNTRLERENAEKHLRELEVVGFVRIRVGKPFGMAGKHFGKDLEANMWELTEKGKAFIEGEIQKGINIKIKIFEMNEKLTSTCSAVMHLLEKPLSFAELLRALNASGIKIRKYKLGDVLKILDTAGQIIKVLGPGGVIMYMKTEGADIELAAL